MQVRYVYIPLPVVIFWVLSGVLQKQNIVAAFWGMHVSPAKYSCVPTKKVWPPDRQTDARQNDPYVSLCFASDTITLYCKLHVTLLLSGVIAIFFFLIKLCLIFNTSYSMTTATIQPLDTMYVLVNISVECIVGLEININFWALCNTYLGFCRVRSSSPLPEYERLSSYLRPPPPWSSYLRGPGLLPVYGQLFTMV